MLFFTTSFTFISVLPVVTSYIFSCKSSKGHECLPKEECDQSKHYGNEILMPCGRGNYCCLRGKKVDTTTETGENVSVNPKKTILDNCGKRHKVFQLVGDNKVFSGSPKLAGEIPWIAHLSFWVKGGNNPSVCGASVLTQQYLLTAAHCVVDAEISTINVTLGVANLLAKESCITGTDLCVSPVHRSVDKIIVHENFNDIDIESDVTFRQVHDIALLHLSKPIEYNDFIQPVCLPLRDFTNSDKRKFQTAGWGFLGRSQVTSNILQAAPQNVFTASNCSHFFEKLKFHLAVHQTQICSLGNKNARALQGDSGGPLLIDHGGKYIVVGVTSFGPESWDRQDAPPVVFTHVKHYVPWIIRQITSNPEN